MSTTGNAVTIPYTDDILASANLSPTELADITRLAGAAKLFADGRLTLGQAAKLYGQSRIEFMATLVKHGYSCVNLAHDDAEDELRFGNG
ncbi:MAG: UPF0175 family protein [Planctomycetota bacterium]|jgi:predicted HTH domain antitoxin|nr:UPF0175 family protein [Planctomycetota bacterium]